MKKISIIIPNYNCDKYISKCLDSVLRQNYNNKEIIVIDDGSTDKSIDIVKSYISKYRNEDIKLISQNNLNASIARNEGMKIASGRYLLFLDSDDVLEDNIIANCMNIMDDKHPDMIIGNFEIINQNDKFLRKNDFFNKNKIYEGKEILEKLAFLEPAPSNKIYDLEVIKKNNICWGNVRIGQDLNFYLKYLLNCKLVYRINENIYKHRIVSNSISRTYDFRIFDIVNSFTDVKQFYQKLNKTNLYENYIQVLELKHYNYQICKQANFETKKERNLVVDYFAIHEKKIDYAKCLNFDTTYKKLRLKFKLKVIFKNFYTSKLFCHKIKKR